MYTCLTNVVTFDSISILCFRYKGGLMSVMTVPLKPDLIQSIRFYHKSIYYYHLWILHRTCHGYCITWFLNMGCEPQIYILCYTVLSIDVNKCLAEFRSAIKTEEYIFSGSNSLFDHVAVI